MTDREEKFIFFYMEQTWNEMRHLENLRERVSVLIFTIASIILGFVVQQKLVPETRFMVWLVIALGVVGMVMGLKIFEIHQMGQNRLNKWTKYLEENCGDSPKILVLRREADKKNRKAFKYISWIPHNYFWTSLHFFIVVLGIVMLFLINEPTEEIYEDDNKEKIENKTNHYNYDCENSKMIMY